MEQDKRLQQVRAFNRVLNTPDGKLLMEELRLLVDGSLFGVDPQETAYRVGRHSVYKELKRLQEMNHDQDS